MVRSCDGGSGWWAGSASAGGGGSGSFEQFLLAVGRYHNRRIINEAEAPASARMFWRYRIPEGVSQEDAAKESVLKRVSDQTGIVFTDEKANVLVLMIERAE